MFEPRASSFLIGFSKTGYLQKILWHLSLLLPFFCITKNWHKRRALNKKEGKIQTVNFQRETENIKEQRGTIFNFFSEFWIEKIIFYLVVDFLLTLLGKKSEKVYHRGLSLMVGNSEMATIPGLGSPSISLIASTLIAFSYFLVVDVRLLLCQNC